jgi:phosphatidylserine/phosphatidylglycerophosphate/cardiolipin synthase-like enzyme
MVEVDGPVATQLARDFDLAWSQATIGGDLARVAHALEPAPEAAPVPPGAVEMRALYTRTGAPEILLAQLAAIRRAQSYIYVEQPYVSDDEIIAALVDARRRGVDVRVVLPTAGDSGFMNAANLIATNVRAQRRARVRVSGHDAREGRDLRRLGLPRLGQLRQVSLRINRETTSRPRTRFSSASFGADSSSATSRVTRSPAAFRRWSTYLSASSPTSLIAAASAWRARGAGTRPRAGRSLPP